MMRFVNGTPRPKRLFLAAAAAVLACGLGQAQGSDFCATPQSISGSGTYAFDNNGATTGTEGQDCTTINSDLWWEWVADFTGNAVLDTCGQTGLDTKVAAYDGTGCPAVGTALACNDDACSLQSSITFPVTSGQIYMLQVGSWSSTTQGSGTFTIGVAPIDPCTLSDDSFEENDDCASAVPMADGSYTGLWARGDRNNPAQDRDFYATTVADGETLTADIFFSHAQADTDLTLYDVSGGCPGVQIDYSGTTSDDEQVVWTNTTGVNVAVVIEVWVWGAQSSECVIYDMDISRTTSALGVPFCFGDAGCPCGNNSLAGSEEGCLNGTGVGAKISASGTPSVGSDSLVLTVEQAVPNEFGIFVQNTTTFGGAPFYNGVICLPGDNHLVRHYNPPAIQPTVTDGTGMGTNAQAMTLGDFLNDTQPGVTIHYQFWGRDIASCGNGANFSSGRSIVWLP